ncbi:unnamed protein product [Menidia menidia]|uniref:(Atlantic silverside) hypothetical protein n=1 Tax=Menidia menidia TaxID=238744 RepID=A0A8S4BGZ2_9TELE|nr:unnamed protein product [Menidia menidia]
MEVNRSGQLVQLDQDSLQDSDVCQTPWPDRENAGPSPEILEPDTQNWNQDEANSLQTSTRPGTKVDRPIHNLDRLKTAKAYADKAVKMHKIFSVQGPYPVIRAALRARGWVEQRMHCSRTQAQKRQCSGSRAAWHNAGDSDEENSDEAEKEQDTNGFHDLMSRLVRNEMVNFYWTNRRDAIRANFLQKEQIINHFAKAGTFTTKAGLCVNLRNLHWFDSADPDTFFPRCYRLAALDERHAFIEDYRQTACTSLLKHIVEGEQDIQREGTGLSTLTVCGQRKQSKRLSKQLVNSQIINSALKVCQGYLESLDHRDIETSSATPHTLTQEEWAEFIDAYYRVVHRGATFETSDCLVSCCKAMLQRLEEKSPQLAIDGTHNIWIIKPGAKSRGRGIKCFKRLDQILRLVDSDPILVKDSKWVVQKYIERPLLVHGTKFDVRQWFLVTNWNPLTVWFYKKCYLRFSTQPYSLDTLESSVHLCNNSIQKHLRPSQQRHRGIPADNMWLDQQFRAFLASQGKAAQWEAVVVPGMKKAIIHALQTAQDLMESRKNTFELYGADFMLGQDLHPWLLEINSSPTMAPSTPVTASLCAAVQEDTLRIVLDRRDDRNADTGDFQLIYRQAAVEVPQYIGINLLVEGFAIKSPSPLPPLKHSHHSAPKRRGRIKEKDGGKVTPLPKMLLKSLEFKNINSVVLPPPPPEPLEPSPVETLTLYLPMTDNKSVKSDPLDGKSSSGLFWRRAAEVSNVYSEKLQLCTTDDQKGSLLQEITAPTQPKQEVSGHTNA